MSQTENRDWQSSLGVMERMEFLLNNPDNLGDVCFEVYKRLATNQPGSSGASKTNSPEKSVFKAHKFVLVTGSVVFHTMFFGSLPQKPGETIVIDDVEPAAFKILLRYLYTGKLSEAISVEHALDVVYVAKKYAVNRLVQACERIMVSGMTAKNATYYCMKANFYDLSQLEACCWKFIDERAKDVLTSDEILGIDEAMMEKIVKRKSLRVREVHVYTAALRWANRHENEPLIRWVRGGLIKISAMSTEEIKETLFQQGAFASQVYQELCRRFLFQAPDQATQVPNRVVPSITYKLSPTVKMEEWPAKPSRLECSNCSYYDRRDSQQPREECTYHQTLRVKVCSLPILFVGCSINVLGAMADCTSFIVDVALMKKNQSPTYHPVKAESVVMRGQDLRGGQAKVMLREPWVCNENQEHIFVIQTNKRPSKAYELSGSDWRCDRGSELVQLLRGVSSDGDLYSPGYTAAPSFQQRNTSYYDAPFQNQEKSRHSYGFVTEVHFEET